MPRDIKIKGYDKVQPNRVYARDVEARTGVERRVVPAKSVLLLTRFRVPSEEQVVDYIAQAAGIYGQGASGIDNALGMFQEESIESISRGVPEVMKHLKRHVPEPVGLVGRTYAGVAQGRVLEEDYRRIAAKKGFAIEELAKLMYHTDPVNWGATFLLNSSYQVALTHAGLSHLLGINALNSDMMHVFAVNSRAGVLHETLGNVHAGLEDAGRLTRLRDESEIYLAKEADRTLRRTYDCINPESSATPHQITVILEGVSLPERKRPRKK